MSKFQQLSDVIQSNDPLISSLGEQAQALEHSFRTRTLSEAEYKHMMSGVIAHEEYADVYCDTEEEKQELKEAVKAIYNNTQYANLWV